MAEYYAQRASAGLIITEGTAPSPNGLGYARIPGIFNAEQVARLEEGHRRRAREGRPRSSCSSCTPAASAHPLNLPHGARVSRRRPSPAAGQMWTDAQGMQAMPVPEAMTEADIAGVDRANTCSAASNAIAAGFDGVELHARERLPARAVPPSEVQPAHRRVRRLDREPRPLRARGRRRRRSRPIGKDTRRHPPVAVRRVQRHARLSGDRSRLRAIWPRSSTQLGLRLHPPRRSLGDGCAGRCRRRSRRPSAAFGGTLILCRRLRRRSGRGRPRRRQGRPDRLRPAVPGQSRSGRALRSRCAR